jgi:hypothetical protein
MDAIDYIVFLWIAPISIDWVAILKNEKEVYYFPSNAKYCSLSSSYAKYAYIYAQNAFHAMKRIEGEIF